MGELQKEYSTQVQFNVIPSEETLKRTEEVNSFGFEEQMHGLVAFNAAGEAIVKMPGHQFGKEEIEAAIREILAAE